MLNSKAVKNPFTILTENLTGSWVCNNNLLILGNLQDQTAVFGKKTGNWYVPTPPKADTATLELTLDGENFHFTVHSIAPRDAMSLVGYGDNIKNLGLGNAPVFNSSNLKPVDVVATVPVSKISPQRASSLIVIQEKNRQLQLQLNKLGTAFKENDFHDIAFHSNNISVISDAMMPFLNDLTAPENGALTVPIINLKSEVDKLSKVAKIGAAGHQEAHEYFAKLQSAAAALTTQIEILKQ